MKQQINLHFFADWSELWLFLSRFCDVLARSSRRVPSSMHIFRFIQAHAQSHPGICSPLMHSIVSNDSVSRQQRPWSDSVNVQTDLCLYCRHMPNDFSHGMALAGLGGSVGCAIRLETRRSWVQPPLRSATFFRGDWSWNSSTVILSLPLIQEGQLSVSGERMCTILVDRLEDYACPVKVWFTVR